ncbi:MAG: BamA/TamA family outer membrane protein [Calothrix sp. SM1_5_4]|nr:BamA/TamA family outer membrane protein [Calothrix sp. SM1_5_4]
MDLFEINGKNLWNFGGYSPPLLVLASRIQGIAVSANPVALSRDRNVLPTDYRVFMGGDENLRGFTRRGLNNSRLGYLSALYLGFELRLIGELPYRIEPFLLWDAARMGDRRFTLDPPLFTSEGLGVRWASPFGTLRGTAARGEIHQGDDSTREYSEEWVYFVSFGQEF